MIATAVVDGSYRMISSRGGWGCVLRIGSQVDLSLGIADMGLRHDSTQAELIAILKAAEMMPSMEGVIYSDCNNGIRALNQLRENLCAKTSMKAYQDVLLRIVRMPGIRTYVLISKNSPPEILEDHRRAHRLAGMGSQGHSTLHPKERISLMSRGGHRSWYPDREG